LLTVARDVFALIRELLTAICCSVTLVRHSLALIRYPFASVRELLTLVPAALALVRHALALVRDLFGRRQVCVPTGGMTLAPQRGPVALEVHIDGAEFRCPALDL
jgi:hypothetical protein